MPQRRSPLLAFLLAVALVAYPVTMPLAMAHDAGAPMAHGAMAHGRMQHAGAHDPASHHHAISTCCAGVCGSCPVVAITAGVSPRIQTSERVVTRLRDLPVPFERSAPVRLPYAIGPPSHLG